MDAYPSLEIDDLVSDIESRHGNGALLSVNDLIYAAYDRIAQDFLTHIVKGRSRRFPSVEYTIFINFIDS
jgi:hypothetical protein